MYESDATDDGLTNRVRACLQKLPETEREVLLLTAWEGLKAAPNRKGHRLYSKPSQSPPAPRQTTTGSKANPKEPASTDRDEPASKPLTNAPPVR